MKKRILALLLTLALAVGVLAGCGYSYAEDDMSSYVETTAEELKELLNKLVIEDGDYTTDPEVRAKKLQDALIGAYSLVGEKKTDGTAEDRDVIYYYYFAVDQSDLTDDQKKELLTNPEALAAQTFFASNMTGNAHDITLGLNFVEEGSFEEAFLAAWAAANFEFKAHKDAVADNPETTEDETAAEVVGNNYERDTATTSKVEAGDVIYVTYTKTWTETVNGVTTTHTRTYTNMRLWAAKDSLNNPTNDPMFSKFVGKAVGSVDGFSLPEGDVADYYKYSDIKINWIVKSPANDVSKITAPIVFEYVPYPETETSAKPVEVVGNSTIDNQPMKGKKLTYYVFPAYYTDTPAEDEITARQIIEDILADSISTSMFDKATLELKNGDVTFETLIKGDSASEDKSMKNSLADIYYYMDYPSYATKETTDETTTQVITRFEGYLKSRLDKIAAIEGIDAKVRADFKTYSEDTLKNTYDETIIKNVTHAIFDIIEDLEMKKDANGKVILPEEAVEEMYEILYENAEATFYTGTTTQDGSTVSLYSVYGTFRNYLIETKTETGATTELTFEQACEKIRDEARAFVERSVKIHFAANAFGLLLTDDEYKEMTYDDGNYNYYVTSYGDIGFRLVYQFDKLFTELLYVDGEKQSLEDYEAELENNPDAEYDFEITYVDGKIKFDNVKYELATED